MALESNPIGARAPLVRQHLEPLLATPLEICQEARMGKCTSCGATLIPMFLTQVCEAECDLKRRVGQDSRWAAAQLQLGLTLKILECQCTTQNCTGSLVRIRQGKIATKKPDKPWVTIDWATPQAYIEDLLLEHEDGQLTNPHRWEPASGES